MIKLVELVPPKPGISVQAFHDHWRHPHGTMALNIKAMRGYIQNHRIDSDVLGPNPTSFEGVAECWFDNLETFNALAPLPFMRDHITPDEERFVDRPNLKMFLAEEEVIMSGPAPVLILGAATDVGAYDAQWSDHNRPLAIKLLQFIEEDGAVPWASAADAELGRRIGALRHVRSRPVTEPRPYLGMRELWWPTLTAFERGMAADPDAWTLLRDRPRRSFSLLSHAERLV